MTTPRQPENRVKAFRQRRGWSQDDLARRAGVSRAAVSAIELRRLVPSVAAALALAEALDCRVEDLFGAAEEAARWAWPPAKEPCRYWQAVVRGRPLLFPVEAPASGILLHDGVFEDGNDNGSAESRGRETLVMAGCDPAAALAAQAFAHETGLRLLVLERSSRDALDLLKQGLVDVAGLHLADADDPDGNRAAARDILGEGYTLLRYASWQEGLAVAEGTDARSPKKLLAAGCRWIGREEGTGARQCQDKVLGKRPAPTRTARSHQAVAEAVRGGWADVGVCLRLVCEDAGLAFVPIREEAYDLCFPTELEEDPRVRALIRLVRSASFRQSLAELPGYRTPSTGELLPVG
jgi:molybdate-binding protein/DNA-binding XRE family transcriptional regulator